KEGAGKIKKREEGKMCKKGTGVGELLQKKKKSTASKVQRRKLEDTLVRNKLAIPELKRMELGAEDRRMHFVSCLVVSEFVNTFKDMLLVYCVPSAETILNALYKGRERFFEAIGHIVIAFLKLLLQDTSGKMYRVYGVRLRMVPVTLSAASGLVHLVLMDNKSLRETERRAAGNDDAMAADSERDAVTPASSSSDEQSQIQV
uniref:Uncharacterized protein n=1 Tax=Parascaris univalens TaxID=6257 RepID=A0A914ZWZ6_PARUN